MARSRLFSWRGRALLFSRDASADNRLWVHVDGPECFAAKLRVIESARTEVLLETYCIADDEAGALIRRELVRAADRGCTVKLLYDAIGSFGTPDSFFSPLRDAGVGVVQFHPVAPWRRHWGWQRRLHRKSLVVDGRRAVIGGLNLAEEYLRPPLRGGFHDLAVEVEGPAVEKARAVFLLTWGRVLKERRRRKRRPPASDKRQGPLTEIVASRFVGDRLRIRWRMVRAFRSAVTCIDILNPYFLPSLGIIRALRAAVRRGVTVRLIVPCHSDVRWVDLASLVVQRRLSRLGVRVMRWPGILHGKAVVVDGSWFSVGSFNFDYQSLMRNLEIAVTSEDPEPLLRLRGILDEDARRSRPWTGGFWERLPLRARISARILYRFRRFL